MVEFWCILECKDVVVPDECLVVHEIVVLEIMTRHDVKGLEDGVKKKGVLGPEKDRQSFW